ncbi:MAG: nucleotidyltransferase domain-containing protein [Solirubrobacterales bacterium]
MAELTDSLAGESGVVLAALIGSRARGEAAQNADVDLLVELDPPGDKEVAELHQRLKGRVGVEVDLTTTRSAAHSQRFWNKAIQEGRVLADRHGRWPAISGNPERARLAERQPVEELASGERDAVEWMRQQDQMADEIEQQQRREEEQARGGVLGEGGAGHSPSDRRAPSWLEASRQGIRASTDCEPR